MKFSQGGHKKQKENLLLSAMTVLLLLHAAYFACRKNNSDKYDTASEWYMVLIDDGWLLARIAGKALGA